MTRGGASLLLRAARVTLAVSGLFLATAVLAAAVAAWPVPAAATTLAAVAVTAACVWPRNFGLAVGAVALGAAAAVWPAPTLAVAPLIVVGALALMAPAYAFVLALVLFGAEGSLKILLTTEGSSLSVEPIAAGALVLDVALLVAVAGLIARDRGKGLVAAWRGAPRIARAAVVLIGLWLVMSVAQVTQGGDLSRGIIGFRLTQAYLVAVIAGLLLLAGSRSSRLRVLTYLVAGLALVSAYAAVRGLVGPSEHERAFALTRPGVPVYGDVFRAVGSFSGAVGLASFLVPTAVFALFLALFVRRLRLLGTAVFVCAMVGVVASYTRAALVAVAVGLLFGAVLALAGRGTTRRQAAVVVSTIVAVLALVSVTAAVASRASPVVEKRLHVFVDPLNDESLRQRFDTWIDSLTEIRRRPFGAGLGTVGRASGIGGETTVTTDNSYLKILREQGVLVGPVFILGLLAAVLAAAAGLIRARVEDQAIGLAALSGFVSFLVLCLAGEYLEQPGKVLAWTLFGIAAWCAWGRPRPAVAEAA